ncbi:MAG: hypothetical protein IAE78_02905, partial [Myxococcus sp.]|nr:hypothetical protein [Myxococcus sp.]
MAGGLAGGSSGVGGGTGGGSLLGGGAAGGGGGTMGPPNSGCGCTSVDAFTPLTLLGLLGALRRRRVR